MWNKIKRHEIWPLPLRLLYSGSVLALCNIINYVSKLHSKYYTKNPKNLKNQKQVTRGWLITAMYINLFDITFSISVQTFQTDSLFYNLLLIYKCCWVFSPKQWYQHKDSAFFLSYPLMHLSGPLLLDRASVSQKCVLQNNLKEKYHSIKIRYFSIS